MPEVTSYESPLLALPAAVAAGGVDAGVAAHYGSFTTEQRHLVAGEGFVDLSHRGVVRVSGPDRLTWLHSLTSQHLERLEPHAWTGALVLSPQGHVEHAFYGYDDGEAFTAHTEPGQAGALAQWLDRMRFMMRVEVTDLTADLATVWRPSKVEDGVAFSGYVFVPRADLATFGEAAGPAAGLWAFEALRIARGEPRLGLDTDHKTIPNEAGWIPSAVHLEKGCYRGQETVARVHTLGRPPRRLTLLHLDGTENRLPEVGEPIVVGDKTVGRVGTSARHHELGPIALGLLKRNVALDTEVVLGGIPATQEVLVDPEVGLHVRPRLT